MTTTVPPLYYDDRSRDLSAKLTFSGMETELDDMFLAPAAVAYHQSVAPAADQPMNVPRLAR